jgi:hypothetical protein
LEGIHLQAGAVPGMSRQSRRGAVISSDPPGGKEESAPRRNVQRNSPKPRRPRDAAPTTQPLSLPGKEPAPHPQNLPTREEKTREHAETL